MFERIREAFMRGWNQREDDPQVFQAMELTPAPVRRTREELIHEKRFDLVQRWVNNVYRKLGEDGVELDPHVEAIITGRVIGFRVRANDNTTALMSFLKDPNRYHLIGFDFQGKPAVTLEGQNVVAIIGLPAPLVDMVVPLPFNPFLYVNDPSSFLVGVDLLNRPVQGRFSDGMAHLFVAGATGSGKTQFIRSLVYQMSLNGCDLALGDGKAGACLRGYDKLEGVIGSLAIEDDAIREMVKYVYAQMTERNRMIANMESLDRYAPLICVIDEIADLPDDILNALNVIARKGRESKTHLVLSTQNPTAKNLGNDIRRNVIGRMAFQVEDEVASKVILPSKYDASTLTGRGDGFFYDGAIATRVQTYLIDEKAAHLDMIYAPALRWGAQDAPALPAPGATEDDYKTIAHKLIESSPNAGRDRLRQAIKEAGLPSVSTDRLAALIRDAKR